LPSLGRIAPLARFAGTSRISRLARRTCFVAKVRPALALLTALIGALRTASGLIGTIGSFHRLGPPPFTGVMLLSVAELDRRLPVVCRSGTVRRTRFAPFRRFALRSRRTQGSGFVR